MHHLGMRDWVSGNPVAPAVAFTFPKPVQQFNGSCLIVPKSILVAVSFAA
jgi:hypothetical protein